MSGTNEFSQSSAKSQGSRSLLRHTLVKLGWLLAALTLAGSLSIAQDSEPLPDAENATDSEQVESQEPEETVSQSGENEEPADDRADPLLDDYEASEQISEDLSVSFPVDI